MPDGPVIANNTPLVALWVLEQLHLLHDLFGEILIPEAVRAEFVATEFELRQQSLTDSPWIKVMQLVHPQHARAYVGLDIGEAEVLALAEEKNACLVILDERKARRYARRLGVPLTGTLGLLLLAKERNLIPAVNALINVLEQEGLHFGADLVAEALRLAGEDPL